MGKFYKIAIPKPCQKDWNTMTPSEKGRFCDSCAKTVVDFTKMSSIQIQDFLHENQNQKICGHVKKSQLDTIHLSIPIHIMNAKHSFRKSFLLALLIAMGTTLISCTNHDGKQQKIENIEIKEDSIPKEVSTSLVDSTPKKCNKSGSVSLQKKKIKTDTEFIHTTGEIIPPVKKSHTSGPIEPFIDEIEGDIEIVVGLFEPNQPINLNGPIPAHLLDTFPALKKTPKEKRTPKNYSKQMNKFISKHFNTAIGENLGLKGVQRIYIQYEIDKSGIIKDIKVRSSHPDLDKEAKRVIKKMPKLIPGSYQNKPVRSIYSLPIVFKIEE